MDLISRTGSSPRGRDRHVDLVDPSQFLVQTSKTKWFRPESRPPDTIVIGKRTSLRPCRTLGLVGSVFIGLVRDPTGPEQFTPTPEPTPKAVPVVIPTPRKLEPLSGHPSVRGLSLVLTPLPFVTEGRRPQTPLQSGRVPLRGSSRESFSGSCVVWVDGAPLSQTAAPKGTDLGTVCRVPFQNPTTSEVSRRFFLKKRDDRLGTPPTLGPRRKSKDSSVNTGKTSEKDRGT